MIDKVSIFHANSLMRTGGKHMLRSIHKALHDTAVPDKMPGFPDLSTTAGQRTALEKDYSPDPSPVLSGEIRDIKKRSGHRRCSVLVIISSCMDLPSSTKKAENPATRTIRSRNSSGFPAPGVTSCYHDVELDLEAMLSK